MKRLLCLLLSLLLLLSFAACSQLEAQWNEARDSLASGAAAETPDRPAGTADPAPAKTDPAPPAAEAAPAQTEAALSVSEDGQYDSRDEVALYIHLYGHLPSNYITKKEAENRGWTGGSLEPYAPGCSIGGSYFGNYEGLLPEARGRSYTECDIDTAGRSSRGAKRIVFSNDGLIYYTDDHYESFTLLYGEADG